MTTMEEAAGCQALKGRGWDAAKARTDGPKGESPEPPYSGNVNGTPCSNWR